MKKLLPKTINNPKGFTLIELLVVISIIAILSVIGIVVFGSVQKGARDAARKADIKAISNAMEANYENTGSTYRVLAGSMFASGVIPTGQGTISYTITGSAGGTTYNACSALENDTSTFCMGNQR